MKNEFCKNIKQTDPYNNQMIDFSWDKFVCINSINNNL